MNALISFIPALDEIQGLRVMETPPMAIYLLKALLNDIEGVETFVIDPKEFILLRTMKGSVSIAEIIDDVISLIRKRVENTDVFIFSCNTFNWAITKNVIEYIKLNYPEKKILIGGLHPSYFYKHIFNSTKVDYVFLGDGLDTIGTVIDSIKCKYPLSHVKNVVTREGLNTLTDNIVIEAGIVTNTMLPNYDSLLFRYAYNSIPIQASVGCMNSCTFCSIMDKNNWRDIEINCVINNIENIINKYGGKFTSKSILFTDDCFTTIPDRAIKLLEMFCEKFLNYSCFIEARINDIVNGSLLERIPKKLFSGIQIGVECGYDLGLMKIGKGTNIEKLMECCQKLQDSNLNDITMLSFIIGFPWEGIDEITLTLNTIEKIASEYRVNCNINYLILLPSKIWENRASYGIDVDESEFDDINCFASSEFFDKTHPKLTADIRQYVRNRVKDMIYKGLCVSIQSDHLVLTKQ